VTAVANSAGPVARWENLDWAMKVRVDSVVNITVMSKNVKVGAADLQPTQLLAVPLNAAGLVEVNML
jgi:hypothetical protein